MQNNSAEQSIAEPDWLDGQQPPVPPNEEQRLKALNRYESSNEEPVHDQAFDRLARLAAYLCDKPIAFINLIGDDHQFHKSCFGFKGITSPRTDGFCQYTIMQDQVFEIEDTHRSNLFKNNPYVTGGLKLRYYAGVPLHTYDGYNIGTLCIADTKPSSLSENDKEALETLADEVISRYELKAAKEELEKKNAEKDELIRIVSHDMRNPLMGIVGFSELLQEEVEDEFHVESLGQIEQSGRSLLDIVNVLLRSDYIRNEASFILNKKKVDAVQVTNNVIDLYRPHVRLKNIDLQFEITPDTIPCELDSDKWKQIVGNLLGNAVKFTEAGGMIKMSLGLRKKHKDLLSFTISDTGIGMDKEMIDELFSGKDDIRRKGTEGEESTGLGMFIVKKYTKLLGGTIDVDSQPGKGTSFKIMIPITLRNG